MYNLIVPFFLPLPTVNASFMKHPVSTVIAVGENATLSCSAIGFPAPEIVWTRDRDVVTVFDSDGIEIVTLSIGPQTTMSSLTIRNASVNLTGTYRCRSITIEGFPHEIAESNPASITVQGMQPVHGPTKI